jgi:hypothetical protein
MCVSVLDIYEQSTGKGVRGGNIEELQALGLSHMEDRNSDIFSS